MAPVKKIVRKTKVQAATKPKCICGAKKCKIVRREVEVNDSNYLAMRWFPGGIVEEECEVVADRRAHLNKVSNDIWHVNNEVHDNQIKNGMGTAWHLYEKFVSALPEIEALAKENPKAFADAEGLSENLEQVKKFAVKIEDQLNALAVFAEKAGDFVEALQREL